MKIAVVGECMLELTRLTSGQFSMAYGGDTLNTAVYLSRLGGQVSYFTALGVDHYSDYLIGEMQAEAIDLDLLCRYPDAIPGLYSVEVDDQGERSFLYWRDCSVAKQYFAEFHEEAWFKLYHFDFLYISGISLSLISATALNQFWRFLEEYRRRKGLVFFDINYRPANWPSRKVAVSTIEKMLGHTDIALPGFDDEQRLFKDAGPEVSIERYKQAGVAEVVLKNGEHGCLVHEANKPIYQIPVRRRLQPVDTTAAGDSFNAGYIWGRMQSMPPSESVLLGQHCAEQVIQHRGAIIPKTEFQIAV